jgi:hypothetical protein
VTRAAAIAGALAAVAAIGCGAPPAAGPAPAAARDDAPAWRVRPPGGTIPIDPGLDFGAEPDALLDARGCAACHAAIVDEWARSRHALAWTNSIFQTEYSTRPQAWCVNCHAPLTTQQADLAGPRAAQGVDCATCHVRAGKLVAKTRRAGSPHETIGDPSFGSPAYCADCHQFTFPVLSARGEALRMTAHPMQTTVASFQAGPYARERAGCMACHGSRHGHAFAGAHDEAMLESAVEVAWCREPRVGDGGGGGPAAALLSASPAAAASASAAASAGAGEDQLLRVTVRNAAAGHTVPTGDIHRHMNLRLWRSSAPEAMFEAYFGRRFDPADDGGNVTTWDSSLAPGQARSFQVPLAQLRGEAGEPVNLELVYVYIGNEFPRPRSAPEEPVASSVTRRTATAAELLVCGR